MISVAKQWWRIHLGEEFLEFSCKNSDVEFLGKITVLNSVGKSIGVKFACDNTCVEFSFKNNDVELVSENNWIEFSCKRCDV